MKNLILFVIVGLFMCACIKTEVEPEPIITTGTIRFISTSNNPYNLYINNIYKTQIPGQSSREYTLEQGFYTYSLQQASGYILTPTIKSGSVNVIPEINYNVVFP